MANGSFGLSGFPTAPTTTTSTSSGGANNALTPVTVAVNSVTGFSSGSLVYNRNGDYGNPVSSTGAATFPITIAAPIYNPTTNASWSATTTTSSSDCTVIFNKGINSGWQSAATLSNGNIVHVYETNTNDLQFRIIDENYNTIVAPTSTGITENTTRAGVCALPTGGFVVFSTTTAPTFAFAIFSNTGTTVTGATTDTTYYFPIHLNVVPRSDGSWIVCGTTNSTGCVYKVYSATGVQVYAWTVIGVVNSQSQQCTVSVRSDNSFVIAFQAVTTNYITYAVRSATNTVVVAPTAMGTLTVNGNALTSVCLSTNDIIFSYSSALVGGSVASIKLTSANVLGSETAVIALSTTYFVANPNVMVSLVLPSDNYLIGIYSTLTSSNLYGCPQYVVANSSMSVISGSVPVAFRHASLTMSGSNPYPVFVKTTNYIHNINWNALASGHDNARTSCPLSIIASRVAFNTYLPVPNQSITKTIGSTASQAVTTYAAANSNSTGAAYLAANSTFLSSTIASNYNSGTIPATQIESFTTTAMDSCALSNGGVAIAYGYTSGAVKISIFNASMVLQSFISFTGMTTSTIVGSANLKITQLSNGKLVVIYATSASALSFKIFSTTYALLLTQVVVSSTGAFLGYAYASAIAPLSGSRFVVAYPNNSNSGTFVVFSDTGTVLVAPTAVTNCTENRNIIVANNDTGFTFGYMVTASTFYSFCNYYETTDQSNSFTQSTFYNSGNGSLATDIRASSLPNGAAYVPIAFTTTAGQAAVVSGGSNNLNFAQVSFTPSLSTSASFNNGGSYICGCAVPAGGQMTMRVDTSNKTFRWQYAPAGNPNSVTQYAGTMTDVFYDGSNFLGGFRLIGLYGTYVLMTFINAASNPAYVIINCLSADYQTALVAGTTPSDASQTLAPSTGYYLLGVASSDCPANGSGNVIINGSATLNNAYPATATAQSFDFSSPVTFGAKGTQLNRNVNLQGNV